MNLDWVEMPVTQWLRTWSGSLFHTNIPEKGRVLTYAFLVHWETVGTVKGNRNEGGNGRFLHWVVLVDWTLEGASAPQGLILASMKGSLEAIWQCKLLPHMGPVAGRVRSPPCHTLSFQIKLCKARWPLNFLVSRTAGPLGHNEQEVIIGQSCWLR